MERKNKVLLSELRKAAGQESGNRDYSRQFGFPPNLTAWSPSGGGSGGGGVLLLLFGASL